jgi:hypothetical protein
VIKRNNLPSIRPSTWKMSSVLRNETPAVFRKRSFSTGKKEIVLVSKFEKMEKNRTFGLGRRGRFITVRPVAWHERPIHSLGPGNNPSVEMGDSVLWRSMAHSDYRDVGVWATPNRNNSGKPESETTIPGSRASSVLSPFGIIRLRFDTEKFWYRIPLLTVYFTRFYT